MDENFEALTLIQTRTINDFPMVLFGKEYYQPLMDYCVYMAEHGTISKEDLNLVLLTDYVNEAGRHISTYVRKNYKVKPRKRLWWFFEKR